MFPQVSHVALFQRRWKVASESVTWVHVPVQTCPCLVVLAILVVLNHGILTDSLQCHSKLWVSMVEGSVSCSWLWGCLPDHTAPTLQPNSSGIMSAEDTHSVMGSEDGLWLTVMPALHAHPSSHHPQALSFLLGVHVQSGLGVKGGRRSVKASSVLVFRFHQKNPTFLSASMELNVVLGRALGCFCP